MDEASAVRWVPASSTAEARDLLLWARANGYRVRELELHGLRMVVDDLRPNLAAEPPEPGPRSVHHAFAAQFGVKMPPDEEDKDAA